MHIPVFRKKVFMNLFETVKTAISVGQAAKRYGLTVGKNGMCCCPFHADKTPSMKLNEAYYYCFGCKAHGDVIALTAQLLHLPPGSAAAELAQAFHVDISACQGRGKERRRQHYQPDTVALAHQLADALGRGVALCLQLLYLGDKRSVLGVKIQKRIDVPVKVAGLHLGAYHIGVLADKACVEHVNPPEQVACALVRFAAHNCSVYPA